MNGACPIDGAPVKPAGTTLCERCQTFIDTRPDELAPCYFCGEPIPPWREACARHDLPEEEAS
jgi:hypothetical protein